MKVSSVQDISNLTKLDDVVRYTSSILDEITTILNGNFTFQDNFSGSLVSVTFPGPSTEVKVTHGLGRLPQGYITAGISVNMVIFNGQTVSTTANIYLQSTNAGVAKVLVF